MLYASLLFFVVLLSVIFDYGEKQRKTKSYGIWLGVVYIVIVCIVGFRYKVGSDTLRYMEDFKQIHDFSTVTFKDIIRDEKFQPLCYLFFSLCKTISDSFYFLQFAHAIFVNTAIFIFLKRNTRYVFLGILFYLICNSLEFNMEIMRESMAVSVFLLGVNYLFKKKYLIYYTFCLIAFGFHVSSILTFIFPLVLFVKFNKFSILFVIGLVLGVNLLYEKLPEYFAAFSFLGGDVEDLMDKYYKDEMVEGNFNRFLIPIIRWGIMPSIAIVFTRLDSKERGEFDYLGIVLVIMMLGYLSLYSYGFYRFNNYLMPFMWILLSHAAVASSRLRIAKIIPAKGLRRCICAMAFSSYVLFSVWVAEIMAKDNENFASYYPYTSLFNEDNVYRPEW